MKNIGDFIYMGVSIIVAFFLLNTGRGLKGIQLFNECLILLNNIDPKEEEELAKLLKTVIYRGIFDGYCLIPDYTNAVKYGKELLVIYRECGETVGEGNLTLDVAEIHEKKCEYAEAQELLKKAIPILREKSNRKGEGTAYGKLGHISYCFGQYAQAREYFEKALTISVEIGDRRKEAVAFTNLRVVFQSLGEYAQAKEYHGKALTITVEIGDKKEEATALGNLGNVFQLLGDYTEGIEYHQKALAINMEIGNRRGEASSYESLSSFFPFLGEIAKAKGYLGKALAIRKEIGGREGEALFYENQATVFGSLGKYLKAKEYYEKALAVRMEIGDRAGVATSNVSLGILSKYLGEYLQAKEFYEKALAIFADIGHREGEAAVHTMLGTVFMFLGDLIRTEGYLEKALPIAKDIGFSAHELYVCITLSTVKFLLRKIEEAYYYLRKGISKSEALRRLLKDNDQLKISFSDAQVFPFRSFILFFCLSEKANTALYVLELERARALADLMAVQYSVRIEQYSAILLSWCGIENIIKKESNCTCLYISYSRHYVFLWILTTNGVIHFRIKKVQESNVHGVGLKSDLDQFIAKSLRCFGILPEESCEDRSLNNIEPKPNSPQEGSLTDLRLVEDDDEENPDPEPLFYKMFIAPVADLLVEPEIIIVPDRELYQVSFSALCDEDGKYLSENFRIRIIPSLTTLKLIQDSPADYHCQTGALIVGDPVVGRVLYKRSVENIKPLPCARKEAEMIGRLLGVEPLLGEQATKQAVLQMIHSVSLIHFAAHGNAERGEIALSPVRSTNRIPEEEEYLLTMSDISQVQLRAKLVVLSCCHSGSGQIRAEGVAGIARAFLGSGARSVLVALWALEDRATEQVMRQFYEHLVRGESASECLHEAMKWMKCNGYSDVMQWAPFLLIGDNVKFDIEKIKVSSTYGGWADPNLRLYPTHHGVSCLKLNALPNLSRLFLTVPVKCYSRIIFL